MRKRTKNILLAANFAVIVIFLLVLFLFIYFSYSDPLTNKLITDKPVKFALTFYGTENVLPDSLETYYIIYERESKLLKILSINTDIVVFKKNVRARSMKYSFFNTAKKDLNLALSNFYQDIFEMTNNGFVPDFYIAASYESLLKMSQEDKNIKSLIENKEFAERDLECLNQLELAEAVLNKFKTKMFSSIRNIRKNYDLIDTNITKLAFTNMIMYFKMADLDIVFFDLPAKYTKTRVEPDKANIEGLLYTAYYPLTDINKKIYGGLADIKNASGKARMAEKAAWKLRENNVDILEWSNYKTPYEKTVIKDYKGNYGASKQVAEILGCGKIIISFSGANSRDASIFIGKDCEIYDKLDKKEALNG